MIAVDDLAAPDDVLPPSAPVAYRSSRTTGIYPPPPAIAPRPERRARDVAVRCPGEGRGEKNANAASDDDAVAADNENDDDDGRKRGATMVAAPTIAAPRRVVVRRRIGGGRGSLFFFHLLK